jgi:hypothetical protein
MDLKDEYHVIIVSRTGNKEVRKQIQSPTIEHPTTLYYVIRYKDDTIIALQII